MKIKKIFTRFICFAITFALMLPMFSEMESYAANDTITVLLWKESASNSVSSSNDAETINEIITNEPDDEKRLNVIICEILGGTGSNIHVEPTFYCDYGYNFV